MTCARARLPRAIRSAVGDNAIWFSTVEDFGMTAIVGVNVCLLDGADDGSIGLLTVICAVGACHGWCPWVYLEVLWIAVSQV